MSKTSSVSLGVNGCQECHWMAMGVNENLVKNWVSKTLSMSSGVNGCQDCHWVTLGVNG